MSEMESGLSLPLPLALPLLLPLRCPCAGPGDLKYA